MALRAIQNRSLADQVFAQLAGEILGGRYKPGDNLPAERALADVFTVNRHVVREALKRLEQIGFVKVSQGGGTRALDITRHAGLDLLAIMSEHAKASDTSQIMLSVLEMRAALGTDAARLCALRGAFVLKSEIVLVSQQMREAPLGAQLFELEVRFWDLVLEGAGNIAYRLAFNSQMKMVTSMGEAAQAWSNHEVKASDYRRGLAAAIAAGDGTLAEAEARTGLRAAVESLRRQLGDGPASTTKPSVQPSVPAIAAIASSSFKA